MRLLAFSDWRTQNINDAISFVRKLGQPVDFILYGGDDIGRFQEGRVNYFTELSKLTSQAKVLAVIGNDDFRNVRTILDAEGVHDLHESPFTFRDYCFIGLEASTSGPAITRHSEEEVARHLERQYREVRGKKVIVLSHTPPHGILDRGIRFASEDEHTHHIGSTSLRKFMERTRPEVVICGHCHSHGGLSTQMGKTTVVNVSCHDNHGAKGNFAVLEVGYQTNVEWHDTFELTNSSDLTNLHSIGVSRGAQLLRAGITTVDQLAVLFDLETVSLKSGFSVNFLKKLQLRALSAIHNKIYQIGDLTPPNNPIFFDIETDISCERVWLIGALRNGKFARFYADDWEQEKDVLTSFLQFLLENREARLVSYSGGSFDKRVLRNALNRTALDSSFFSAVDHVDLCQEIRRNFIFPNQSYALKELGLTLGYPFKHPDLDGFSVALSYHRHVEDGEPLDKRVIEYNEDDVRILPFLIQKLASDDIGELAPAKQTGSLPSNPACGTGSDW